MTAELNVLAGVKIPPVEPFKRHPVRFQRGIDRQRLRGNAWTIEQDVGLPGKLTEVPLLETLVRGLHGIWRPNSCTG